ncbi:hypothetical protein LOTGIDRAFT_164164 [Lottia gigantea]|uniref:Uncharacterized protein n=1 Tax=Lottia gigantea TaxID=225164 RepID=V3ZG94_LOTGI|nr:hypothetical protein LOTGIDRAFT_164164 [Lottia gigantea]ESO90243.1 hypothetical protein LOTGIDRAFT_164164 [Lottia gigantea]
MAYNSLLPPELQPVYQQHYGEGVGGAASYVTPLDPVTASQMTYHHEGMLPFGDYYSTPVADAVGFDSQPVIGHYNPPPYAPNVYHSMVGKYPPPYKSMPVLPPIAAASQVRIESSPAVLQGGSYTIDGTLVYGDFIPTNEYIGQFDTLPVNLRSELRETYGVYPRTDVKIVVNDGRYHLYATPIIRNGVSVEQLPPVIRPRFHHLPMPVRRGIGFPRPLTGLSETFGSVNLSRASNYHRVYRSSSPVMRLSPSPPLPLAPIRERVVVRRSPSPLVVEEVPLTPQPPRMYANYVRTTRLAPSPRRVRYRSPTRYTERNLRRGYIESDGRVDMIRDLFHP